MFENTSNMFGLVKFVVLVLTLNELGTFRIFFASAQYENHWISYYEQPCCAGQRRVRHHKGKFFWFLDLEKSRD